MALAESPRTPEQGPPMALDSPAQGVEPVVPPSEDVVNAIIAESGGRALSDLTTDPGAPVTEDGLIARFSPERITGLANQFFEQGTGENLKEKLNGRGFAVAYIHGNSPYSDLPRAVEQEVFSEAFGMPQKEVFDKYSEKDDEISVFACVFDTSDPDNPRPIGALRMVGYNPENGFKDVNALVADVPYDEETREGNPWLEEVKALHFQPGEEYDPKVAIERIVAATGGDLKLEEGFDVTSHSVVKDHRGRNAEVDSPTMLFFHACLDEAVRQGKTNLVAIFDLGPFRNLQQYGEPFNTHAGLSQQPYDGEGLTQPAYCILKEGIARIEADGKEVLERDGYNPADVFIRGEGLDALALMPHEMSPQRIF